VHFIAQIEDVTARREAQQALERMLDEKDVLLHEVHHRVKNNLQVISSLLNLQRRAVQDPLTRDALDDSRRRVLAMALVHERLYQGRNLAAIDMARYLNELVDQLCRTMAVEGVRVRATVSVDQVDVPVDVAIPCGLIVNELLSNVLKYAFAGRETGTVRVSFARAGDAMELAVIDDGVGMPEDVRAGSIGMRLVESLARQFHGTLSVTSDGGVHAVVRMPDALIGGRP
jgi:two-component sensor histidine kinase